jgi:hypothetical protein
MTERHATCKICGTTWSYHASRGPTATVCKLCRKEASKQSMARFLEKRRQQREVENHESMG